MSDAIIGRNILSNELCSAVACVNCVFACLRVCMLDDGGILDCGALDEMGSRIDELEKSIADLMEQVKALPVPLMGDFCFTC